MKSFKVMIFAHSRHGVVVDLAMLKAQLDQPSARAHQLVDGFGRDGRVG